MIVNIAFFCFFANRIWQTVFHRSKSLAGFMFLSKAKMVPGRGREASRKAAIRTAGSGSICLLMLHLQHKDYSAGGTKETKVYFGTRERNWTSDQKFRKLLLYPLSYPGFSLFLTITQKIKNSTCRWIFPDKSLIRTFSGIPVANNCNSCGTAGKSNWNR